MSNRFFKCIKQGGCRLSDLELSLVDNQFFKRSAESIEGSNSVRAALNSGWIEELTEDQFQDDMIKRLKMAEEAGRPEAINPGNIKEVESTSKR